jgi:hypothetical protein
MLVAGIVLLLLGHDSRFEHAPGKPAAV